jgi:HSP20 family protein
MTLREDVVGLSERGVRTHLLFKRCSGIAQREPFSQEIDARRSAMPDFKSLIPWREQTPRTQPRGEVAHPFESFRREMDRMFDDFFGSGLRPSSWQGLSPALDMGDTGKELVVTAELPGVTEADVDVSLLGDVLTIKGEKKAEHEEKNGDRHYTERRYGAFTRSVRLPFEVGEDAIEATFDKGILKIRIPKSADAQRSARKIQVRHA